MKRTTKQTPADQGTAAVRSEVVQALLSPQNRYAQLVEHVERYLRNRVEDSERAREAFAGKIAGAHQQTGNLARSIRWGEGVEQDLEGDYALKILDVLPSITSDGTPYHLALGFCVDTIRRDADAAPENSTNPFSNAIHDARRVVARRLVDRLTGWREALVELRAEMEVL